MIGKKDICYGALIGILQIFSVVKADIEGWEMASGELYQNVEGAYSVRFGKTEYTVWHRKPLTWQNAYDFCERYNSSLVVLNEREKIVKLQLFLVKNNFVQAQINDDDPGFIYWIGGNDLKERNKWMWIPINKPFTYTHWLVGEPTRSSDQRCVEMGDKALGRWSNSPCSLKRYFICERSFKSVRQRIEL
ncbi:CD209 antigen-like protein C [Zeugodacus cucurbitae]|uniref:p-selectin n=1 Tax=Zeugodacus cucurbitae TaxID=28588 RepID=A0A0A1X464_ZEUCU|nr:CD209 antigen-like protein C [Zeugodacus cucurbitae]